MNEDVPKRELGSEEHPDDDAGLYVISVAAELSAYIRKRCANMID